MLQKDKTGHSRVDADLANMLIIEAVPLAITERFDACVVVATCSTPRMDHDREQLKGQQTLRLDKEKIFLFRQKQQPTCIIIFKLNMQAD